MEGSYHPGLVALSVLVAMAAGYVALDMAARVADTDGAAPRRWSLGGGLVMGLGIWSMHFIGMLAFELPIPVAYDGGLTVLSAVFPIALSVLAIHYGAGRRLTHRKLLVGGFVMGMGICAMHYTGMAAMRMQPAIRYEPSLLAASMLVAVSASWAALALAFYLRGRTGPGAFLRRGSAAAVMGLAIAGMHYTAMAAARFSEDAVCTVTTTLRVDSFVLACAIAVVVLLLILATLAISALDAASAKRVQVIMDRLRETNAALTDEVAQREELTTQLRRSNRELEQLAELAARHLQRPLHALRGFVEVLDDRLGATADADLQELMQRVTTGTGEMQKLIDALVELADISSARVQRDWVPLRRVVTDARLRLAATIGQRNVQLTVGPLPTVLGDTELLARAFFHLIDNAIKFQPVAQPVVEIFAQPLNDGCRVVIADHGIGIPEQHHGGVFELFRRLNPQSYDGAGIGLPVVRRIVYLHGIEIELAERAEGGLAVCLDWPAELVQSTPGLDPDTPE